MMGGMGAGAVGGMLSSAVSPGGSGVMAGMGQFLKDFGQAAVTGQGKFPGADDNTAQVLGKVLANTKGSYSDGNNSFNIDGGQVAQVADEFTDFVKMLMRVREAKRNETGGDVSDWRAE